MIGPSSGLCKVRYTCITLSKVALFSMVFLAIIKQAHSDNILLLQAGQAVWNIKNIKSGRMLKADNVFEKVRT